MAEMVHASMCPKILMSSKHQQKTRNSWRMFAKIVGAYLGVHLYLALFLVQQRVPEPKSLLVVPHHSRSHHHPHAMPIDRMLQNQSQPFQTVDQDATIIVQLKGEMCNNLQKIAFGYGLHLWAKREFGMATNLVLRHLPKKSKWVNARNDIHLCFPKLRQYDFEQGNRPDFKRRRSQQADWLGSNRSILAGTPFESSTGDVGQTLQSLVQGVNENEIHMGLHLLSILSKQEPKPLPLDVRRNITIPHIWVGNRPMNNLFLDKFYEDFREFFDFDKTSNQCCAEMPDPNESVFHYRQFSAELSKLSSEEQRHRGYTEMSPDQAAHELFGNLHPGDKLAMTTRFADSPSTQAYLAAFRSRGLDVRLITNQTGVQDFCFLLHAQKELVGIAKSTYVRWAGLLGRARRVRLYSVGNASTTADSSDESTVAQRLNEYKWKNPEIASRFHFEVYDSRRM